MIGSVCSIYTFSLYNILLRKLEERTTWIVVGRLTIIRIIKKRAVNLGREFNGIWRVKCRALMNDLRKHWEMSWCSVKKKQTLRNKLSLYVCVLCMRLVRCQYNEHKYLYSTDFGEIWFLLARLEGERRKVLVAVNIRNGTSGMWRRVIYWWYQTLRRNLLTASTGERVGPSEILLIYLQYGVTDQKIVEWFVVQKLVFGLAIQLP